MFRYHTHSWNDSSEPLGASFLTTYLSGALLIWKENYIHSKSTTTEIVHIADSAVKYLIRNRRTLLNASLVWIAIGGNPAAVVCTNCRSRPN